MDMKDMNCFETVARLHLYIDRELSSDEIEVVQQHLDACPNCECRFHFDMHVKRLIHEHCAFQQAPAHLREAVMRIARTPVGESIELDPQLEMGFLADLEE